MLPAFARAVMKAHVAPHDALAWMSFEWCLYVYQGVGGNGQRAGRNKQTQEYSMPFCFSASPTYDNVPSVVYRHHASRSDENMKRIG